MASLNQGVMMSSPSSDVWWSLFHESHGRDSEEDKAFTGYLYQQGIPAGSGSDVLAEAYTAFRAFMDESYERAGVEETADQRKVREARDLDPASRPVVPRSSVSDPSRQKPLTAATRPPVMRDDDASPKPSPLEDPNAVQAATAPGDSAALEHAAGSTPSGATPQEAERAHGRQRH